jgi:hypothetical protein
MKNQYKTYAAYGQKWMLRRQRKWKRWALQYVAWIMSGLLSNKNVYNRENTLSEIKFLFFLLAILYREKMIHFEGTKFISLHHPWQEAREFCMSVCVYNLPLWMKGGKFSGRQLCWSEKRGCNILWGKYEKVSHRRFWLLNWH